MIRQTFRYDDEDPDAFARSAVEYFVAGLGESLSIEWADNGCGEYGYYAQGYYDGVTIGGADSPLFETERAAEEWFNRQLTGKPPPFYETYQETVLTRYVAHIEEQHAFRGAQLR